MRTKGDTQRKTFGGLMGWLFEQSLFENLDNPEKVSALRGKLGISKGNPLSNEDLVRIIDKATDSNGKRDSPTIAAMAKYYPEVKNMDLILAYMEKASELNTKLDYNAYPTFKSFTEKLDEIEMEKSDKEIASSFSIENTEPDYATKDGRYKVYEANSKQDCIKYGNGYTFCISTTKAGNMYHQYRKSQESKYYFVFDTELNVSDEKYITVVDAQPNGKYEFTHKDNRTKSTSEDYGHSLDNFMSSKPGLHVLKDVFKPNPLSPEEHAMVTKFQELESSKPNPIEGMEFKEAASYIEWGFKLSDDVLKTLSDRLLEAYMNQHVDIPLVVFNGKTHLLKRFFKILHDNYGWSRMLYSSPSQIDERIESVLIAAKHSNFIEDIHGVGASFNNTYEILFRLCIPETERVREEFPFNPNVGIRNYIDFFNKGIDLKGNVMDHLNLDTLGDLLMEDTIIFMIESRSIRHNIVKYVRVNDVPELMAKLMKKKWFNGSMLYGFITTVSPEHKSKFIETIIGNELFGSHFMSTCSDFTDYFPALSEAAQREIVIKIMKAHPSNMEIANKFRTLFVNSNHIESIIKHTDLVQKYIDTKLLKYAEDELPLSDNQKELIKQAYELVTK
jgi:hypothetical protein